MIRLAVVEGPNRGAVYTLLPGPNRLGRDAELEVTVPCERASRRHAELAWEGDRLTLTDAGSANGTYLNGVRCAGGPVRVGDELRVGDVALLVVGDGQPAPHSGACRSTLQIGEATGDTPPPRVAVPPPPEYLIGDSPAMRALAERIHRAAAAPLTVRVHGESGTGKELVARALHRASARRDGPLIVIGAGTLSGPLAESELFGHEAGAFSGAVARRQGAFELADGGTLVLDDVACLPAAAQAGLLRVVEGHGFRRVGGERLLTPDVRVVALSEDDLGALREDLRYRLSVLDLALPPLRERTGDVTLLARHFLAGARRRTATPGRAFDAAALRALEAYDWPGNVRELANAVARAAALCSDEAITSDDLPPEITGADGQDLCSLREMERRHVARALAVCGGNKSAAARLLEIDRVTLYGKLRKLGIDSY